jgi:hypothetical protein
MATNRIGKLRARRTDPLIKAAAAGQLREVYDRISEDESVRYAIGAMQPIDDEYTKNTYEEGNRVKAQLDKALNQPRQTAEFEYQGSVTNNTHIKAHSDIDLLALHAYFYSIQPPGKPALVYPGDLMADLRNLRSAASKALKSAYPAVTVDDAPGKAISLEGGSLQRKIDVVISNWWDTVEYQASGLSYQRGVHIFDSKANVRIENRPFLHNARIDARDRVLNGNVRKVARLLKSLRYDADTTVDISSYDITSIAYRMPDELMGPSQGAELALVENARLFLRWLLDDDAHRALLKVPNEMRPIFCTDGASVEGLKQLYKEIQDLVDDIAKGLSRSFRKLAEARVSY